MALNPKIWLPIAAGLSVINLAGVRSTARQAEPRHASIHATLALVLGLWAQRIASRRRAG